ncbi:MAG: peptidyl-prolyl cis-trans isomerase [Sedimentisphaerales bacterium]|nr:peptidyl-prolyl cis-trans isomerase [Sedimentisphaerales bacterium]
MSDSAKESRPNRDIGACVFTLSLALVLFLLVGCGTNEGRKASLTEDEIRSLSYAPQPSRPDELIVSGEVITCQDVMAPSFGRQDATPTFREKLVELAKVATLEEFMELARPQVRQRLNANITNVILYRRAERTLGDKVDETLEAAAEKELRRFVLEHGGNNAQADEALKARGQTRTSFKQAWKKQALAQYAYSSQIPRNRPVTYSELVAAYDEMKDEYFVKPGSVQFRLIDVQPARMVMNDPNADPSRAARALAESLVTRIIAGEDFAALAKEFSHGFRAESGGLWTPRDPESLAEPYTILADAAAQIEVGQIAGPLDAPGHCFIMKLEAKDPKGYLPLAQVQDQVEEEIAGYRNLQALEQLDEEVAQQIAVADTDRFLDYCLEQIYRTATESASAQAADDSVGERP